MFRGYGVDLITLVFAADMQADQDTGVAAVLVRATRLRRCSRACD